MIDGSGWVGSSEMAFPLEHVENTTIVHSPSGGRNGLSLEGLRKLEARKASRVQLERGAISAINAPPRLSRYGRAERLAQERALMTQCAPPLLVGPAARDSPAAVDVIDTPMEHWKCPITLDFFYGHNAWARISVA